MELPEKKKKSSEKDVHGSLATHVYGETLQGTLTALQNQWNEV